MVSSFEQSLNFLSTAEPGVLAEPEILEDEELDNLLESIPNEVICAVGAYDADHAGGCG